MPLTINPGSGGEVLETENRNGLTDERTVWEHGALPTYWALGTSLAGLANRFFFVLYNNSSLGAIIQIRKVVWIPTGTAAVTSLSPGLLTQRVRISPTTDPTGTGGLTINSFDSADTLPANITAFSTPSTVPAGGTTMDLLDTYFQADELKPASASASDAPTTVSFAEYGGVTLYEHNQLGFNCKPITLRQDQCYEIQQGATSGVTSTYRVLCIFSAF